MITIWSIALNVSPACLHDCRTFLSAEESLRADRFVRLEDQRRFTVAHAALREILGRYLQRSPCELHFSANDHGKPYLEGVDVAFNLSHSYEQALLAVSDAGPVGVDIEYCREKDAIMRIAQRFFSEIEYQSLLALPEELRTEAFYRCWTLKEAYVKAIGLGLTASLSAFSVNFSADSPHCLVEHPEWLLSMVPVPPGYVAAVGAKHVSEWSIRTHSWTS